MGANVGIATMNKEKREKKLYLCPHCGHKYYWYHPLEPLEDPSKDIYWCEDGCKQMVPEGWWIYNE